jgi:prepilin-type N-terminal cleavage/methylation domain-containing protein
LSRFAFHASRFTRHGFSLIEILVVVALLSGIILGLLAMFDQTKKAFTTGMTQVDVLEGGRSAMEIISRELSQMSPAPYDSNAVTFYAEIPPVAPLWQPLPGNNPELRRNVLEEMFFLTREGNSWKGIGYWVGAPDPPATTGVAPGNALAAAQQGWGTLYRFQTNSVFRTSYPWQFYSNYNNFNLRTQRMSRIIDGVVHFKVRAYDPRGIWITNNLAATNSIVRPIDQSNFVTNEVEYYQFWNDTVPAFLELELGVLEARTLARARSIPDATARRNYLQEQVGRVHIFRTRVPVRNVDPAAYQ